MCTGSFLIVNQYWFGPAGNSPLVPRGLCHPIPFLIKDGLATPGYARRCPNGIEGSVAALKA